MNESIEVMRHKIAGANTLESVVRIMKMIASSNLYQYENLKKALETYYYTVNLSLSAYFKDQSFEKSYFEENDSNIIGAIVFGGDNGLVGQFNEMITDYTISKLKKSNKVIRVWTIGEGVYERFLDSDIKIAKKFRVASSVKGITHLVGDILIESESSLKMNKISELYIFYNSYSKEFLYEPVFKRILPLDDIWLNDVSSMVWPNGNIPEIVGDSTKNIISLIDEYLFVSVYKACAESLIAENASRLATSQRAEKNIDELISDLTRIYQMERKNIIDEEMFDVISGFERNAGK